MYIHKSGLSWQQVVQGILVGRGWSAKHGVIKCCSAHDVLMSALLSAAACSAAWLASPPAPAPAPHCAATACTSRVVAGCNRSRPRVSRALFFQYAPRMMLSRPLETHILTPVTRNPRTAALPTQAALVRPAAPAGMSADPICEHKARVQPPSLSKHAGTPVRQNLL